MFDEDTMFNNSWYFPGLPWPLLTNAKGAKGANVEDDYIESASIKGICTRGIYTILV